MTMFTIPAELVPLARSGAHLQLCGALDDASALLEAAGREASPGRERYREAYARIDKAHALLDELGRPQEEPAAAEVYLGEHRDALVRALRAQEHAEQRGAASLRDPEDPGRRRAQESAESLADLVQRVQATRVAPVDREPQLLGSEYLIASCVCDRDHPEGRTRGELEEELRGETPPEEIADALGRLRAAGVVVRDGERLRPSRPALYLNELGALGF
jgi:hypothetical protein